jgi:hypothetical protein
MTSIINASTIGPVRIFVKRRHGFTWWAEIAIIAVP